MLPLRKKPPQIWNPITKPKEPGMTMAPVTFQPPEQSRARLAALGQDPRAINAGTTSLQASFSAPPSPFSPNAAATMDLRGYRGGPAAFAGGGAGFRPLAANQATAPAQLPMRMIPPPRPLNLPPALPQMNRVGVDRERRINNYLGKKRVR